MDKSEIDGIVSMLTVYACDCYGYQSLEDKDWVDNSIINICEGFDHVKNYDYFKNIKKIGGKTINIVDKFLVLESRDGELSLIYKDFSYYEING